jgi:hypothetical protein
VFFEVRNLPAQSRLAYIQSGSSSREIQFLSEDIDSEKVTDFNVGEQLFVVAIDRRIESVFQGPSEIPELKSWKVQSVCRW